MSIITDGRINSINTRVQNGLRFILSHLSRPHFPRNIMTHRLGRQILVHNLEETMQHYNESEFLDCRISAYPPQPPTDSYIFLGNGLAPNLVMIDIDKSRFTTKRAYELAVSKTLKIIKVELNANPTVIWSGNGCHIIQPMNAFILEEEDLFHPAVTGTDQPSVKFLRWAERYLSGGKSDQAHSGTLSFGNCMLRIPGSHNSKCVRANNGVLSEARTEVKLVHEWDGYRPKIILLIGSFHAYLVDQKIKQSQRDRKQQQRYGSTTMEITPGTISWIEKLLTMSISDNRKYCIWRILAPYLINIKKLQDEQASYIIREWLEKCNSEKRVSFDRSSRIRYDIQSARKNGFYPIGLNKLKIQNKELFDLVKNAKQS
jgi:hypothetical protein